MNNDDMLELDREDLFGPRGTEGATYLRCIEAIESSPILEQLKADIAVYRRRNPVHKGIIQG